MKAHTALTLHPDARITPVIDLPASLREGLDHGPGDHAIGRRRSRVRARVVDADGVELLREFERPVSILEAVVRYCTPRALDPVQTLEQAFPLLERMTRARLLVPADEALRPFEPALEVGDTFAGYRVIQRVRMLEDSEVYRVEDEQGRPAALKLVPADAPDGRHRALEREALALARAGGTPCPRVLEHAHAEPGQYLVLQWCHGSDAASAARTLRQSPRGDARGKSVLDLAVAIARAFASLHARGVLHGDVHPGNIRVDEDHRVWLIDLGAAALSVEPSALPARCEAGLEVFRAPELARALLEDKAAPALDLAREQYSLAALIFMLLTGHHTRRFSIDARTQLQQIVDEPVSSFAAVGATPWPQVEAVLARGLASDPTHRYRDATALADALERCAQEHAPLPPRDTGQALAEQVVDRIATALSLRGSLGRSGLSEAPLASVNFGAAGIAYFALRLATVREDPSALSLADLWITRAEQSLATPSAFYGDELAPDRIGQLSLYHTAAGVHWVRARVSDALGDRSGVQRALARYVAATQPEGPSLDLMLGKPGLLLGAALLLDGLRHHEEQPGDVRMELRAAGERLLDEIWRTAGDERVLDRERVPWLGVAHGWAGVLYATLLWSRVTGRPLPGEARARLDELADTAQLSDGAARWPRAVGRASASYWPGWCHGSTGHVFMWDLADRVLGCPRYAALADRSALDVSRHAGRHSYNLCCGLAGQAYALLNRFVRTGDPRWQRRAWAHAAPAFAQAEGGSLPATSLYKGEVGVAVLAAEIGHPQLARMPLFEG